MDCTSVPNGAGVTELSILFTNQAAFDFTRQSWSEFEDLSLVTYTTGCGAFLDGTRSFWLASDLAYIAGSLTITVTGTEINIELGVTDLEISWGDNSLCLK